jgi:release factor glutamine methyltransferase
VPAARQPASKPWTTRTLLAWMSEAFKAKGLDAPQLQARVLLAHILGCEELRLFMDPDRPATDLERHRLRELVGRALKDEPIQYLVGEWRFFGLPFHVDKRVLIPRPATETIVEHVLQHARVEPGFGAGTGEGVLIADVCTGSGCIAVALLKNLPGARAVASDLSPDALDVARQNATRHGVADRLDLLQGNLLDPIRDHPASRGVGSLHYLVSNPPYIPDHEWDAVPANVKGYEPPLALRGGPDGMDQVRPLIAEGPDLIRPGGLILIEVADSTAAAALELLKARDGIDDARILSDVEGLPRVIVGRRTR